MDDDDNDICPVCDGDCTCRPRPVILDTSLQHTPLKIKLTVPQSMLANRHKVPPIAHQSDIEDPGSSSTASTAPPPPRRKRRPPKAPRSHIKCKNIFVKQKTPLTRSRLTKDKQAAVAISRKVAAAKRRGRDRSETVDSRDTYDGDDDDDRFPTFVSASALSSLSSDSDSSSTDAFETDSEIEAEEENFIIHQVRDKARVRRELLGDDCQTKRIPNNNWVIRPRKKSVGPSDGEMDVDSDATVDDDDNDEEDGDEDEEDDEDETDVRGVGAGYVGLATGWSEDDESSFDADLFFANLSGSDSSSTPTSDAEDDADPSDMESVSATVTDLLPHLRQGLENLPFEVTESWDGQIVFTNGLRDGQGVLDIDFEIDAAQFMVYSSPSSGDSYSDVDMIHSDRGYEEDLDWGEGDTTDEELVGENDLPNERAMQLFSFPLSVSAINPLSTVSPAVSPGPRSRRPLTGVLSSPKPADILAGRVFWESDELDDVDDTARKGTGPRKGCFAPNSETRTAVIDDSHKAVPSPHPSFRRDKLRRMGLVNPFHHRHHASITDMASSSPVADRSSPFVSSADTTGPIDIPYFPSIALNDVLEPSFLDPEPDLIAVDHAEEPPCSSSAATSGVESDAKGLGFNRWDLVSVSADAFRQTRETGTPITDSGWRSGNPTTSPVTDYGKMIRASPFTAMRDMLASSSSSLPRRSKKKRVNRMVDISPVILPRDGDRTPTNMHLNSSPPNHPHHTNQQQKSRKELRRERKLKRKSAAQTAHQQQHQHRQYRHHNSPNSQHYQHHHAHRHYPNSKSRGLSAVQRTGFGSSSSVPPLSL
ncbi:hypothetical protein F5887DRAFT_883233 [Amanita rubescens]|nr:hypothetical protein F5887DRAFT_883233 [Amanita rubescens]